eukprot:413034_1
MGVCHSSKNQLQYDSYNMTQAKGSIEISSDNYTHFVPQKSNPTYIPLKSTFPNQSRGSIENKIRNDRNDRWTKLFSVPESINMSKPLPINENEILIMPCKIKNDMDFDEIPTYLHLYNITNNTYTKLTKYPHDFPKGIITTTIDKNTGTIYIFTRKGYIVSYNIKQNKWKWEIIYGAGKYDRFAFKEDTAAVIHGNILHIITNKQHIIWNKCTKELKLLHMYDFGNYASMICRNKDDTMFLIGANDTAHHDETDEDSLDTIYSYSFVCNQWVKLKNKLPFSVNAFGCMQTMDQRYILMFGGEKTLFNSAYNGILIVDTNDFSVRKSDRTCPVKGAVYACGVVDYKAIDLVVDGLVKQYWRSDVFADGNVLLNDVVALLKMFYCVEYVHLFDRERGYHWKIQVDSILM